MRVTSERPVCVVGMVVGMVVGWLVGVLVTVGVAVGVGVGVTRLNEVVAVAPETVTPLTLTV
ncbi:MAG: hypothetical protein A4E38_00903 [Methanoregulaceae archaeon PtaB.Bin108]|nr:MAG: hypothetical protein A4E38_00903 [Methanoregulaceae archaeon PtaB.Bin108]